MTLIKTIGQITDLNGPLGMHFGWGRETTFHMIV
jgi:hypothetical protein